MTGDGWKWNGDDDALNFYDCNNDVGGVGSHNGTPHLCIHKFYKPCPESVLWFFSF